MRSFGQLAGWQEGGQSLQPPAWSWSGTEEEDRHLMDEAPGDRSGRDFMLRQDGERLRYRCLSYCRVLMKFCAVWLSVSCSDLNPAHNVFFLLTKPFNDRFIRRF